MNQIKTMFIALFAIVAATTGASSQENQAVFNLKSSIEYSLKNNPSSTIYNNQAEIARFRNQEGLAGYLPQVNANATVDYNLKLQTSIIPAGIFGPEETRIQIGNKHVNGAVVQLDQKVYDQAALTALEARKVNLELARTNILKNNEDLIYQTTNAYYQVLILNEQEKLLRENEKQYTELLRILKLQFDKGVIKKVDYDRTRVGLNNITSQLTLLETNKKLALNKLKISMGMPIEQELKIDDNLNYEAQVTLPPQGESYDVSRRLDYIIQDQNILLQEIQTRSMRSAGLPTVGVYARYGANAFGTEFASSFNNWFDYSAIGLKINIPLFNGLRVYSTYKQSELTLINLKENAKLNIQNFKLETENANTQLLSSYTSLNNNKENMQLAKDVYEASNLEYKEGTASLTDFLNSDYAYKEAQSNYINSLLNYLSSRLQYEKAKGTLTNYINQL